MVNGIVRQAVPVEVVPRRLEVGADASRLSEGYREQGLGGAVLIDPRLTTS